MAQINPILETLVSLKQIVLENADPQIMYFLVKDSVVLSAPKLAIQVGHGVEAIMSYCENADCSLDEWKKDGSRKVLLSTPENIWKKIVDSNEIDYCLVQDFGLTELDPYTQTILVLLPVKKSKCPKIIKRLRLY